MKQNITLRLDRDLIRKAKVVAARLDTSVSEFLSAKLEEIVGEEEAYERAQQAALTDLEQGFHLGGTRIAPREELHER